MVPPKSIWKFQNPQNYHQRKKKKEKKESEHEANWSTSKKINGDPSFSLCPRSLKISPLWSLAGAAYCCVSMGWMASTCWWQGEQQLMQNCILLPLCGKETDVPSPTWDFHHLSLCWPWRGVLSTSQQENCSTAGCDQLDYSTVTVTIKVPVQVGIFLAQRCLSWHTAFISHRAPSGSPWSKLCCPGNSYGEEKGFLSYPLTGGMQVNK